MVVFVVLFSLLFFATLFGLSQAKPCIRTVDGVQRSETQFCPLAKFGIPLLAAGVLLVGSFLFYAHG